MLSRYRYVVHSDRRLVCSANIYPIAGDVADYYNVSLLLADFFEDEVAAFGPLHCEELVVDAVLDDHFGQRVLADLALKLVEVVVGGAAHDLLLDLGEHPVLEAADVDVLAAARAQAGAHHEVVLLLELLHAHLAERALLGLRPEHLQLALVLEEGKVAGLAHLLLAAVPDLDHRELDPAQLQRLPDF